MMKTFRPNKRQDGTLPVRARRSFAFTIIEMMLAIGMFMMILFSIYSIWSGIVKASLAARKAADRAQRGRIAMNAIESALVSAQMFSANMPPQNEKAYYSFDADAESGEYGKLSFIAHLPATFPGVGRYGDRVVRRVSFTCEPDKKDGTLNLVMRQSPMLEAANPDNEPYELVLAKEVALFGFEMWGQPDPVRFPKEWDWVTVWKSTNALPTMMRVGLGLGKTAKRDQVQDLVVKIIALPAKAVPGSFSMSGGAQQKQ